MKKVFVVSKTHLDLGFTNYAETIRQNYINTFIPQAIELASKLNAQGKKRFVWTTGSWVIKEALENGSEENKKALADALRRGDIAPHAMPFTTHTELLDADTLTYGLSIVDTIDEICGRKTIAAKVTDVPGHTKALVPYLAKKGIRLLHIGVNGASALPNVPPCFVWKDGEYEIVVIYSGDYGGPFECDLLDEVLYFDHTLDNHGAPPAEKILNKFKDIERKYPGYEVVAGRMDDFAQLIWEKRSELPVLDCEIGDTWIHGSASDPYKSASFRELMELKRKWLEDGSLVRGSKEYIDFTDAIMCVAEHTCGMDMKTYLADYEHYLKKDFVAAREADTVKLVHPFRDFPQNLIIAFGRLTGNNKPGSYSVIERSWKEQRDYISKGVNALSPEHKAQALHALDRLRPKAPAELKDGDDPFTVFTRGDWSFRLNTKGGIGLLTKKDDNVINDNDKAVIEYHSYGKKDYDFWLHHYTRNLKATQGWAIGDFSRPLLKYADKKYPQGRFEYRLENAAAQKSGDKTVITANLECDSKLSQELGAPRKFQIVYTLTESGLKIEVMWFGKDASRLTEGLFFRLFPQCNNLSYTKIARSINPMSVAENGGRNISAVFDARFTAESGKYKIENHHAPLICMGAGKILEFDNRFDDCRTQGLSYILYDNVWGTNFPLWYEENAYFAFDIKEDAK